jgi:hypothetical protein
MTLNLNCKDAGDPICTHAMQSGTEEEILKNTETWNRGTWLYRRDI